MYINERRGSAFNTPLHNAATKPNLEIARLLLEVGAAPIRETTPDGRLNVRIGYEVASINARNEIEATPLMFAAGSNQTEMMLYLMDHGADLLLETESGGTAMHFAVRSNSSLLVAAFLEKVVAISSGATAVGGAPSATASTSAPTAVDGDESAVAVDILTIVNHANNQGWVPLHFAARQGNVAIAKLLVNHGAEVDAVESRGETALQQGTNGYHLETLPVRSRAAGYNSLLVAAALQQHEVASFLLRSGADATKQDDGQLGGKTALEHMPHLRGELR